MDSNLKIIKYLSNRLDHLLPNSFDRNQIYNEISGYLYCCQSNDLINFSLYNKIYELIKSLYYEPDSIFYDDIVLEIRGLLND